MGCLEREKEKKQLTDQEKTGGHLVLPLRKKGQESVSIFKILFCAFLLFFFLFCARITILQIFEKDLAAMVSAFLMRQGLGMPN